MGFGGPIQPPPSPGIGGGAAMGQVNVPGYQGSGADQMNQAFGNMYKGIEMRNDTLMKNKQLAQQQAQFQQSQAMDQQKLDLDTQYKAQQMKMEQEKLASLQKTQMVQQQRDAEKAERDRVKGEMDVIDWKNKQAAQDVLMKNLPVVDKILNDGTADSKVYDSPEYKNTLAALSIVDPKAAAGFFSDAQKRRYETAKNAKESASYSLVAPIYTESFPQVMESIHAGKPISEAVAPVKTKLDQLYKTGQISPEVYKQTLQDYIKLTQASMKKLNGEIETYKSYDAKGQLTTDPTQVARQVSNKSGKVLTVGGKVDPFSQQIADMMGEEDKATPTIEDAKKSSNFWDIDFFGGDE
jgi:hypothetical protein